MSLLTACAHKPSVSVVGECAWTRYIILADSEIDALVDCCPDVARAIFVHNELRDRFCVGAPTRSNS